MSNAVAGNRHRAASEVSRQSDTPIPFDDAWELPEQDIRKLGSNTFNLNDVASVRDLFAAATSYQNYYRIAKEEVKRYAHKALQLEEEIAMLKEHLRSQPQPGLSGNIEYIASLEAENERLRTELESAPNSVINHKIEQMQKEIDLLKRNPSDTYRPRAEGPVEPLDGSSVEKYHGWRFAVDQKFDEDYPYYGENNRRKIAYALKKMVYPIFNTMQLVFNCKPSSTYVEFMSELENEMGVHLEAGNAKRELRNITMKPGEKVSEYYHRIHPLWCLAKVPENDRVEQFLTTLHPSFTHGLLAEKHVSMAALLDRVRKAESRKIDQQSTFPRTNPRIASAPSTRPNTAKDASPKNSSALAPRTSESSYPNNEFGPVAKKPEGWVGTWYDPETRPKKLTDKEKAELRRQGRCWACRGSGHRGPDKCCPFHQDKQLLQNLSLESDNDSGPEN